MSKVSSTKFGRWGCCIGLILALCLGAFEAYRAHEDIRNSYTVWFAADLVVEHMIANDGQWPTGWNDLRDDYQARVGRGRAAWSFEEISQRVVIDWNADPAQLLAESKGHEEAPFKVIRLSDGSGAHWSRAEPNQIILDFLRSQTSAGG